MLVDRALVIGLLVGEVGLREHVLVVDHEEQVLVRLQMQAPGVVGAATYFTVFGFFGSRTSITEKPFEKMCPT